MINNFKFSRIIFLFAEFTSKELTRCVHFEILLVETVFDAWSYQINRFKIFLFVIFLWSFRMIKSSCAEVVFDDHSWVPFTWKRRFCHIVGFGKFFHFFVKKFEILSVRKGSGFKHVAVLREILWALAADNCATCKLLLRLSLFWRSVAARWMPKQHEKVLEQLEIPRIRAFIDLSKGYLLPTPIITVACKFSCHLVG